MTNSFQTTDNTAVVNHPARVTVPGIHSTAPADLVVPRLILLQAMSPQLERVPDTRAGQLLHSITLEPYDSVSVCSVDYWREYVLFRKRDLGGGYIDAFSTRTEAEAALATAGENPLEYEITDTAKHLCLLLQSEQAPQPVVIYCARSQHRFSRTWNTQIQLAGPEVERWSTQWQLSPVRQQNIKGSWYSLAASLEGWTDDATREIAVNLSVPAEK